MTRRGKETDNPVFLLKRKRGGGSALFRSPLSSWLCCFSCCTTEHLLLRSLMRHQGLRIITVYYKRLVEFCHLVYTDKKIVHDLHTANLPANASTQLCVVAQRASDMKAVDPPPNLSINNAQWRISSAGNRECEKIPTQRHDLVCLCAIVRHRATAAACSGAAVPTVVEGSCGCQQLDLIPLRVWCEFKHGNAMSH